MLNRSSIPRTTSSTHSQAEHLHLLIHLATTDILETRPLIPTRSMEASILIAGRVANRAKILHCHPNNTIGGQTQASLRFSNHRTLATMHPLRLHPSTPPQARVLVAGKTARVRMSVVRTVSIPQPHRGLLRHTLRRGRVTHPDLRLRPTSDPTIDTLPPHPQRRPLPPDQTELRRLRVLLRIMPPLRRPRPRPRDPLNRHHCLKGTTP